MSARLLVDHETRCHGFRMLQPATVHVVSRYTDGEVYERDQSMHPRDYERVWNDTTFTIYPPDAEGFLSAVRRHVNGATVTYTRIPQGSIRPLWRAKWRPHGTAGGHRAKSERTRVHELAYDAAHRGRDL